MCQSCMIVALVEDVTSIDIATVSEWFISTCSTPISIAILLIKSLY